MNNNQNDSKNDKKEELSVEERLLNLEENMTYIKELVETNNDSYSQLIKALDSFKQSTEKYDEDLIEWAETVEKRIGMIMVEHVNLSLVIRETITITPEQQKNIERHIQELKRKHEKDLEEQGLSRRNDNPPKSNEKPKQVSKNKKKRKK